MNKNKFLYINKKIWSLFMIITLLSNGLVIFFHGPISISYAKENTYILKWKKADILDDQLRISGNQSSDQDVLLDLEFHTNGNYQLEYYLEDNTRTLIDVNKGSSEINIDFNMFYIDDTTSYTITESLRDVYYAERNYEDNEMVENPTKAINGAGAIEFTIEDSASNDFPGVEFNLNQRKVIMKWDVPNEKLYIFFDSYSRGNIMPVKLTNPEGTVKEIDVLRSLESFKVSPTQNQLVTGSVTEIVPVVYPNALGPGAELLPGNKPGLEIKFTQPKKLGTTYVYDNGDTDLSDYKALVVLEEFGDGPRLDFEFQLTDSGDTTNRSISSINWDAVNAGAVDYNLTGKEYTINIVQDKSEFTAGQQGEMIQWNLLEPSKVYNLKISVSPIDETMVTNLQRDEYKPQTIHAFTYLDYEIIRTSIEEAFLRIKPYNVGNEEEVTYNILSSDSSSVLNMDDHLWLTHYYQDELGSTEINIPVPFDGETDNNNYQVIIDYAGNIFGSQVLKYNALVDNYVETTTPIINSIDNLFVVPIDDESAPQANTQKIQFDISWKAPTSEELNTVFEKDENAIIYYEMLVNQYPYDTGSNEYKTIKVFEVYNAGDAVNPIPALRDYSGAIYGDPEEADEDNPAHKYHYVDYADGYNEEEGLFRMNNIVIYDSNDLANGWINILDSTISDGTGVTETAQAFDFNFLDEDNLNGVNYIRMRAITQVNGNYGIGEKSLPISLTLGQARKDIPVPDGLSYEGTGSETVAIEFRTIDDYDYERYMLYPIDKAVVDEPVYRVFLASGENVLKNPLPADLAADPNFIEVAKAITDLDISIDSATLEALREVSDEGISKVLYFDYQVGEDVLSIRSNIEGLEGNGNYYVRVQSLLTVDNVLPPSSPLVEKSELSKLLELTVPKEPADISDDEIHPIAVDNFEVSFANNNKIELKLDWDYSDEIIFEEDRYGFEIIGIKDLQIASALLSKGVSIEDILNDPVFAEQEIEGWRAYVTGSEETKAYVLDKYTEGGFASAAIDTLIPTVSHIQMIDKENSYNGVYYYYVRTIKFNPNEDPADPLDDVLLESAWSIDTITTAPVAGPVNLQVLYDTVDDYDPQYQGIICFDAPIPITAEIGPEHDYDIEIHVQGEMDDGYTYIKYPTTLLEKNDEGDNGHTRYFYRINELESGEAYNIKVRIVDNSNENEEYNGDKSRYSNKTVLRTNFNQEDYEKELIYNKYIDLYIERMNQILSQPYFERDVNSVRNVIKYRDDIGIGQLLYKSHNQYDMHTENVTYNTYYIPSVYMEEANEQEVDLRFKMNGNGITIRKDGIGKAYTNHIQDKLDKIKAGTTTEKDYYIRVSIMDIHVSTEIMDKVPISNKITLDVDIIGAYKTEEEIDILMIKEHERIRNTEKDALAIELIAELETGINEENVLEIVEAKIEHSKNLFAVEVDRIMNLNTSTLSYGVSELNSNLQIKVSGKNNDNGESYYKEKGSWVEVESTNYGETYYIDTDQVTEYIIFPFDAVYSYNSDLYVEDELKIINQYKLDEILGVPLINNPELGFYQYRFIDSVAMLLGYEGEYTQNMDFLEEEGLIIPLQGENTLVKKEKALYVLTQAYCKVNNVDINQYEILDYNKVKNLNQINQAYHRILLVGANLEIYDLDDGYIQVGSDLTIGELIEIITKTDMDKRN